MSGTPVAAGNARLMETLGLEVPEALSALALQSLAGRDAALHCFGRERYRHHRRRRQGEARIEGRRLECADAASGS